MFLGPTAFLNDPDQMQRAWPREEALAYTHWLATHHVHDDRVPLLARDDLVDAPRPLHIDDVAGAQPARHRLVVRVGVAEPAPAHQIEGLTPRGHGTLHH